MKATTKEFLIFRDEWRLMKTLTSESITCFYTKIYLFYCLHSGDVLREPSVWSDSLLLLSMEESEVGLNRFELLEPDSTVFSDDDKVLVLLSDACSRWDLGGAAAVLELEPPWKSLWKVFANLADADWDRFAAFVSCTKVLDNRLPWFVSSFSMCIRTAALDETSSEFTASLDVMLHGLSVNISGPFWSASNSWSNA